MSNKSWIDREIELAIEQDSDNREFYETLGESVKSLQKTFSKEGITRHDTIDYIWRLMDRVPITPIEDVDREWTDTFHQPAKGHLYESIRYPYLHKDINADGTGETLYFDTRRYLEVDINVDGDDSYKIAGRLISKIAQEYTPIEFPYVPSLTQYRVYVEKFKYHTPDEDSPETFKDTFAVIKILTPDGKIVDVMRYFKYPKDGGAPIEINKSEYFSRKIAYETRANKKRDKEANNKC